MRHAPYMLLAAALAACAPRSAEHPADRARLADAVATITPADIRDRIAYLASDRLRGRGTPSPGLDSAAAWIARQFADFGLLPAGSEGWLQRYPYPLRVLDVARARFQISAGASHTLTYGSDFYAVAGDLPDTRAGAILVGSTDALAGARSGELRGRVALVQLEGVPESGPRGYRFPRETRAAIAAAADAARDAGAAAVAFLLDPRITEREIAALAQATARPARAYASTPPDMADAADTASVAGMADTPGAADTASTAGTAGTGARPPLFFVGRPATLRILRMAGLDPSALVGGGPRHPVALPGLTVSLSAPVRSLDDAEAPNVVALLPGSDSTLRGTYVLVTSHMDHLGVGPPVDGDSIYNGADDDASGTAAVIEIAEAFASLASPPRRSLLFLTVSGEEKGLLGSRWFTEHPTVPLDRIVADLNLDMVGRNAPDTIVVIGQDYSSLGPLAHDVARDNPGLGLTLADDLWPEQRFFFRSDHFSFAVREIPALFFFAGTHDDYHRPGDEMQKIDTDKNARVARLVFLIADRIANADDPPRWTHEGLAEVRRLTSGR